MTETITYKKAAIGLLMSLGVLAVLAIIMEPKLQAKWQKEQLASAITSIKESAETDIKPLPNIKVEAQSAIVYDVQNRKVLYAKNPDTPMPLASITKLITALVGNLNTTPISKLTITQEAIETEGDSGLLLGDTWLEKDLLDYMLTVSSNDAAAVFANNVMSRQDFILAMNNLVKQMGLGSIKLRNESGLDLDKTTPGAYGSARDIALLMSYISILDPSLLEATSLESFTVTSNTGKKYKAVNTNKIVNAIPGLIGGKTGYTDLSGGNLAVVFDTGVGHYVVVVVLGSSREGRFDDVLKLVNAVL